MLEAEDAAELAEELQAVNSTATPASDAQAATVLGLGAFVILMMSKPSSVMSGSASHVTSTTLAAPPWLGASFALGYHHGPFGIMIDGGTGDRGSTDRTDPPYPKHWPSPR